MAPKAGVPKIPVPPTWEFGRVILHRPKTDFAISLCLHFLGILMIPNRIARTRLRISARDGCRNLRAIGYIANITDNRKTQNTATRRLVGRVKLPLSQFTYRFAAVIRLALPTVGAIGRSHFWGRSSAFSRNLAPETSGDNARFWFMGGEGRRNGVARYIKILPPLRPTPSPRWGLGFSRVIS